MENKSIIGFGYTPNNAKAVCLKTNSETRLGGVEYKIIADPYEREFVRVVPQPLSLFGEEKKVSYKAMAVNVLDSVTGLTYAVEYEPANLVRPPKEYKWGDVEITVGGRRLPVKTITRECERKPSKLIGSNYNPEGLKVIDLETLTAENLGSRKYRIISAPYAKKFGTPKNMVFDLLPAFWNIEKVWIDVMDPVTERTYAVEFVPARVHENKETAAPFGSARQAERRDPSFEEFWSLFFKKPTSAATKEGDRTDSKPGKSTEQCPAVMDSDAFLRLMKERIQEIEAITDENPDLLDSCSVAFFAAKRNGSDETADGVSLVCGQPKTLTDSIVIPAKKSNSIMDMIVNAGVSLSTWRLARNVAKRCGKCGLF